MIDFKGLKKRLHTVLANLLVFFCLLLILEIALRILGLDYGSGPLDRSRVLHHTHPTDYSFTSYDYRGEFGGFDVTFDQYGRRVDGDDKNYSTATGPELWFLGDSFTEGLQVNWAETFVARIANKVGTHLNAVNYGVSGYSPILNYVLLKQELKQATKPAMVFIQLCLNDYHEELQFEQKARFDLHDRPLAVDGGSSSRLTTLLRHFYLAKLARRAQLTLSFKYKIWKRRGLLPPTPSSEGWNLPAFESDSRLVKSISQIHSLLDSADIPHYFFAIPSKQVSMTNRWDRNTFSSEFINFANLRDLPYIALDSTFKTASRSKKLFFEEDFHCNANGHEVISEVLLNKLAQDFVLPKNESK